MADGRMTVEPMRCEVKLQPATLKHVTKWWAWNWPYLAVFLLATAGSLAFGFIPGCPTWAAWAGVGCTIVSAVIGFKAGGKYHREIIR
jgi:membrane protein YdbS with pleckstrin-like domain